MNTDEAVKMTTEIFYSQIFKTSLGPVIGPKFINFPEALKRTGFYLTVHQGIMPVPHTHGVEHI